MLCSARSAVLRFAGARCFSTEIPINTVCRVVSMNVGDEATPLKMDELAAKYKADILSTVPGFVRIERKVCKSEWDYSTTVHFDSLEALQGYMGDEEVQAKVAEALAGAAELVGDPSKIHRQNFVVDDL